MNFNLPVILLKSLVLLPYQEVRLELNNELSKSIINLSSKSYNNQVLVVCPVDQKEENPEVSDLPLIGVVGKIKTKIELPNKNYRVVITGIERVDILSYFNLKNNKDILVSKVKKIELVKYKEVVALATLRKLKELAKTFVNSNNKLSNVLIKSIDQINTLEKLTDVIAAFLPFSITKKFFYMNEVNAIKRADALINDLNVEVEVIKLDEHIDETLKEKFRSDEKNIVIEEKINLLRQELDGVNTKDELINNYKKQIDNLKCLDSTKNKLYTEVKKFEYINEVNPESGVIRTYLDTILSLPWGITSSYNSNLSMIKKALDKTHYGLDNIKNTIIEYIAVTKVKHNINSPIICLVGPPGVGKSSISSSIAASLNREFCKISVGGLNDSSELIGHRRTYIGANPGKIIESLKKCKTNNPVILIDEVDKMVKDYKGDPASTLLDILDKEMNKNFIDNYIEEPFDLSNVMFILTANDESNIPNALLDRLEVINLNSYTEFEKLDIAKKYLLPKIYENHGIKNQIKFSDNVISYIISNYTSESGVRDLERKLTTIIRKVITENITDVKKINIEIKKDKISTYLGNIPYERKVITNKNPGTVNALACNHLGGFVMPIETVIYDGEEKIILTGSLGDVIKESVMVALSYIKDNNKSFKIKVQNLKGVTIHLHALEGAIKKEGPSAGVTMVTSLLSVIKGVSVDPSISMTGEISLKGEVLKVGGIKEKIISAYNNNIKLVFIPYDNKLDLEDVPSKITKKIKIIPVKDYMEIYNIVFK